ncbi:hypothetical protein F511_01730 [Dorcoceras hygrometricum]|uniref:S-protein homolog n=1 Tax=Dorcoceras hygrometricum TaxID=472368 RepID=A0A2Z7ASA5_9LAMI|nr:hypothetical protein F511_01730 [Dorcoceras hygrometricum]
MRPISATLAVVISLSIAFLRAKSCTLTSQYTVYIVSNLPPNTPMLSTHCWSRDDDLGSHTLAPGQNYNFNFCESAEGSTKFTCRLWWNGKDKTFDVFSSSWTFEPCDKTGTCNWFAKEDGIYFSNRNPPWKLQKVYPW